VRRLSECQGKAAVREVWWGRALGTGIRAGGFGWLSIRLRDIGGGDVGEHYLLQRKR
jgi:hypothetical protein